MTSSPADGPREPIAQPVPASIQARALIAAEEFAPNPQELVRQVGAPDTVEGWQALADSLLTEQACVFHRNVYRLGSAINAANCSAAGAGRCAP